jgi:2-dehydropantoate 2-reductase
MYMRVHFTKVSDQTRWMLREYITLGTQAGLPVEELRASSSP